MATCMANYNPSLISIAKIVRGSVSCFLPRNKDQHLAVTRSSPPPTPNFDLSHKSTELPGGEDIQSF